MPTAIEQVTKFTQRLPTGCRLPRLWDPCREYATGGVARLWVIEAARFTDAYVNSEGVVTAFQNPHALPVWLEMKLRADANFTQAWTDSADGRRWTVDIAGTFGPMDMETRTAILGLLQYRTTAIVLDRNGRYWLAGHQFGGLRLDNGNGTTGAGATATPGYALALRGFSYSHLREVAPAALSDLVFGTDPTDAAACATYEGPNEVILPSLGCDIEPFLHILIG